MLGNSWYVYVLIVEYITLIMFTYNKTFYVCLEKTNFITARKLALFLAIFLPIPTTAYIMFTEELNKIKCSKFILLGGPYNSTYYQVINFNKLSDVWLQTNEDSIAYNIKQYWNKI